MGLRKFREGKRRKTIIFVMNNEKVRITESRQKIKTA